MKSYILLFIDIVTRFFTALTFVFALLLTMARHYPNHDLNEFSAIHIIKIFIVACAFGVITVARTGLENKKWMLRLSFIQKRWIFFPLYLITMLLFIYDYGIFESFGFREVALCTVFFFIIAGTITAIAEKKYKEARQNLTNAVNEYKNKIAGGK